ncbi:MAG TPA: hypothetical protein VF268_12735 [Gammaproteobacteria bacterium]
MPKTLPLLRITLAIAALAVLEPALAAKYYCGRQLTPEETAQAEQIMEKMRKALPPAADGWVVSGDSGGVSCLDTQQPKPANISVRRSYVYLGEAAADSGQAEQARFAEAERKLAALKQEQEETAAKLNAARATRDPKVMQPIQQKLRELQLAQAAQSGELAKLRGEVQRKAQARKNAEREASRKPENKASISVTANKAWFSGVYPGGKQIDVAGATLAIQDARQDGLAVTQLYFGGKLPEGEEGKVAIDAAAPMLKVQNLAVRIDAWPQATEQLLKGIDAAALKELVQP